MRNNAQTIVINAYVILNLKIKFKNKIMKVADLLAKAQKTSGENFIGLLRKSGRIKHGIGSEVSDILGWDVVVKGKEGNCFAYYCAQTPLLGCTMAEPITCPVGIVAFDDYKIDINQAIEIFKSQNGGDHFTEVSLCWPLVNPAAVEPHWYFRTNLGNEVVIGANSGQISGMPPMVVLYMGRPE